MSEEGLPTYVVRRRRGTILIDGRLDEPDWAAAEALRIEQFLETAGRRDVTTTVRLLWDDWNLYLGYHSRGGPIFATHTRHNQMVWEDTCVEFFVSPEPDKPQNYYTWEINCVGVTLNKCLGDFWGHDPLAWRPTDAIATSVPPPTKSLSEYHAVGPRPSEAASDKAEEGVDSRERIVDRRERRQTPPQPAEARRDVRIGSKSPRPDDEEWFCEVAIPFSNFALSPVAIPPKAGDQWRANFQQCAGPNSHLATWAPLPPGTGSFHTPQAFGRLIFSDEPVAERP
jgi:hypothetical protein